MADIELKCPKCSQAITVSEFVDLELLTCHACGSPLKTHEVASEEKPRTAPRKLTIAQQAPEPEISQNIEPTKWQISQQAAKEGRVKPKFGMTHVLWSTIIFFLLGGTMGYLRYCDGFLAQNKALISLYGPIIVITMHLTITIKAFKDSVFHGTLCLLMPFYSLYYLFGVSDDFYMRAIVGGLLIGIGQDSFTVFNTETQRLIKIINDWIASGG